MTQSVEIQELVLASKNAVLTMAELCKLHGIPLRENAALMRLNSAINSLEKKGA